VHGWWPGILGCAAFGWIFFESKLYPDVALQLYFIVPSTLGLRNWKDARNAPKLPIRRAGWR